MVIPDSTDALTQVRRAYVLQAVRGDTLSIRHAVPMQVGRFTIAADRNPFVSQSDPRREVPETADGMPAR